MYHSITFGNLTNVTSAGATTTRFSGKNTWEDWGLVPTSRPLVNPPAANRKQISIPGTNGTIDLSTLLTGYMTYGNRTGSWEFLVENKNIEIGPYKRSQAPDDWVNAYTTIMGYLHGKSYACVLEDDPTYYYQGNFDVSAWKSDQMASTITINYDLQPFKYSIQKSDEPWLWDPFNFETGVIRELGHWVNGSWTRYIDVSGSKTITIPGFASPGNFEINCYTAPMTLVLNGTKTYSLPLGITKLNYVVMNSGDNTFAFTGTGTISIIYRAGEF